MHAEKSQFLCFAAIPLAHLFPGKPAAAGELYQASVMSALMNGVYEGDLTYGELRKHGDFHG